MLHMESESRYREEVAIDMGFKNRMMSGQISQV